MATHSLVANITTVQSLAPAARTNGTANGTAIDMQGYEGLTVLFDIGAWTDGTHALKLQDSPDNSVWTDVAAANQLDTLASVTSGTGDDTVQYVGYRGKQRYVRPVITTTGATSGAILGAVGVRSHARHNPVNSIT